MKLKENIVLTELGDDYIAVPVGETAECFRGIVRFNETGAFICRYIMEGLSADQIAGKIIEEYDGVDFPQARKAVAGIIDQLLQANLLEDAT